MTFTVARDDVVSLSVSALNTGDGTVGCEIDLDGVKIKQAQKTGIGMVDCEYMLMPKK